MLPGNLTIERLLAGMGKYGASDLHIKVGVPPTYRIAGVLRAVGADPLTPDEADHLLDPIVPAALKARYDQQGGLDFAAYNAAGDRFRVNMFRAGAHTHAAIRRVKAEVPSFEALHLPAVYRTLTEQTNEGLVLVVGVTGCGKSTTLAAMVQHLNQSQVLNIVTIEDPVEYRFIPAKSIVSQREIGIDVPDFKTALRAMVRQDPDVVFIGELRDHETVLAAVQAAETGHLVFASMHTADTMQSLSRMLEFFPQSEHAFIRSALATSLKAVCAQRLLPAAEGFVDAQGQQVGVVPATEVLIASPIVKDRLREAGGETDIPAIIAGAHHEGMRSFTQSLAELVQKDMVAQRVALEFASSREALEAALRGVQVKAQTMVGRLKTSGG